MPLKTQIHADDGRQDIKITRDFDLPVELLFRAYQDAEIVEQWMGTKVLKLENRPHGGYEFETSDPSGNVLLRMNGTIHEFSPNTRIVRTFEMENTPFEIQLEFLDFVKLDADRSRLEMHVVYRSNEFRDEMLKLPFAQGLNMAHDRLQEVCQNIVENK